ncbi:fungal-specific transcription factor domain-containing protein [Geopyxis carbonaria]|nr:fungal-specific transcription factor domain-containing protein [Geopyxis carbonaria]
MSASTSHHSHSHSPTHSDDGSIGPGPGARHDEPRRQNLRNPACDHCREKKIRCDRAKPSCAHCRTSRISCVYSDPPRRPADGARSINRFEEVNARLARIEDGIAALTAAVQASRCRCGGGRDVTEEVEEGGEEEEMPKVNTIDFQIRRGIASINDRGRDDPFPPELPGRSFPRNPSLSAYSRPKRTHRVGLRIPNEQQQQPAPAERCVGRVGSSSNVTPGPEDVHQYLGSSSIMGITSEAQMLAEERGQAGAVAVDALGTGALGLVPPYEHRSLRDDARKVELNIPWRQEAEAFVQEHFKSIHCWYPIFEETSFRADMEKMYANPQSIVSDNSWVVCFNMVMLFGLYGKIINMTAEQRKALEFTAHSRTVTSFYNAWSALDDLEVFMTPKIRNVQALLTMAICGIEISRPTLCWSLLSQAARSAQALGLHRRDNLPPGLSKKAIQERRSLFWVIYTLDKCMSLTSGRSASLPEYDCDVELPTDDGTNPYHANFLAMIALSRIQARIYVRLYSAQAATSTPTQLEAAIVDLDAELRAWWDQWGYLSALLESDAAKRTPALALFEHLQLRFSHYNSETLIHRMARPGMGCYKASEAKCLDSARAAIRMVLDVVQTHPDLASSGLLIWLFSCYPFTSFFILFSAIIRAPAAPAATQVDLPLMQGLVAYFANMKERNEGAARLLTVATAFTNVAVTFLRNYSSALRDRKRPLAAVDEPAAPPAPHSSFRGPPDLPPVTLGEYTAAASVGFAPDPPPVVDFATAAFLRWPEWEPEPPETLEELQEGLGGEEVEMGGQGMGQGQVDLETLMAEPLGLQMRMEQAAMRGPLEFDWFGWDASFQP